MNAQVAHVRTKVNVLMESISLLVNVLQDSLESSAKMVECIFQSLHL